jgi:hypothetical protein
MQQDNFSSFTLTTLLRRCAAAWLEMFHLLRVGAPHCGPLQAQSINEATNPRHHVYLPPLHHALSFPAFPDSSSNISI